MRESENAMKNRFHIDFYYVNSFLCNCIDALTYNAVSKLSASDRALYMINRSLRALHDTKDLQIEEYNILHDFVEKYADTHRTILLLND